METCSSRYTGDKNTTRVPPKPCHRELEMPHTGGDAAALHVPKLRSARLLLAAPLWRSCSSCKAAEKDPGLGLTGRQPVSWEKNKLSN